MKKIILFSIVLCFFSSCFQFDETCETSILMNNTEHDLQIDCYLNSAKHKTFVLYKDENVRLEGSRCTEFIIRMDYYDSVKVYLNALELRTYHIKDAELEEERSVYYDNLWEREEVSCDNFRSTYILTKEELGL